MADPEWTNGDSILVEGDDFRLTIESQLDSLLPEWTSLCRFLIPMIGDEYRASEFDDDTPGMCLTIGFTPETVDKSMSWSYQTGDNSFSGGAYCHANWAVVSLYRDSDPAEVANEIASQLAECFWN